MTLRRTFMKMKNSTRTLFLSGVGLALTAAMVATAHAGPERGPRGLPCE